MQWTEKWIGSRNPKMILVQPPISRKYQAIETRFAPAPPTWAAILVHETLRRSHGLSKSNFEIFYPPVAKLSKKFYEKCAQADIIGMTDWFSCHEAAMEIASRAKEINPNILVIIGGLNATNMAPRILKNRQAVDLIVADDGEDALWQILAGRKFRVIPNLWYRDGNGELIFSYKKFTDLDDVGVWDFEGLVEQTILERYRLALSRNPCQTAPLGVSMTRGCRKCQMQKPCIYCTAWGAYRETSSAKSIGQLRHLADRGYQFLFETGDDFSSADYLEQLSESRQKSDSFRLRCYADPANITSRVAHLMAEASVYEIFLGFETADERIAARSNRDPESLINIDRAIANLEREEISVCLPIMFGLPGETVATARATARKILELVSERSNIRLVLVSLAMPLAGSGWFRKLSSSARIIKGYPALKTDDELNYFKLLALSLQQSETDINKILEVMEELKADLKKSRVEVGSFGAIEHY
jgi:radical SAM superfamily enzyme YgiQ (UPF0313 family)